MNFLLATAILPHFPSFLKPYVCCYLDVVSLLISSCLGLSFVFLPIVTRVCGREKRCYGLSLKNVLRQRKIKTNPFRYVNTLNSANSASFLSIISERSAFMVIECYFFKSSSNCARFSDARHGHEPRCCSSNVSRKCLEPLLMDINL